MSSKQSQNAYPILDGRALVKVSLNRNRNETSPFEEIVKHIRSYMIDRKVNSMLPSLHICPVPIVRLNRRERTSILPINDMELNLVTDAMPILGRVKLALGGALAAGLLVFSAWGMAQDNGLKTRGDDSAGLNFVSATTSVEMKGRSAVVLHETGNEQILLASIINPANNYPFQKIGHTNLPPTTHSNTAGNISHTNTDAYTDFTPHSNAFHSNQINPHTNIRTNGGHTNTYGDSPGATP